VKKIEGKMIESKLILIARLAACLLDYSGCQKAKVDSVILPEYEHNL